jgi:hypothetical protein
LEKIYFNQSNKRYTKFIYEILDLSFPNKKDNEKDFLYHYQNNHKIDGKLASFNFKSFEY